MQGWGGGNCSHFLPEGTVPTSRGRKWGRRDINSSSRGWDQEVKHGLHNMALYTFTSTSTEVDLEYRSTVEMVMVYEPYSLYFYY